MNHSIIKRFEAPLFATVQVMGDERHQCAFVSPAEIAGAQVVACTFYRWALDATAGDFVGKLKTLYYGPSAIFSFEAMSIAAARNHMIASGGLAAWMAFLCCMSDDAIIMDDPNSGSGYVTAGDLFARDDRPAEDPPAVPDVMLADAPPANDAT